MSKSTRTNYVPNLGEFRGDLHGEVDPIWVFIHEERVRRGLSGTVLSEMIGHSIQSSLSKGEKGGMVSLTLTQTILRTLGYRLEIVPVPED